MTVFAAQCLAAFNAGTGDVTVVAADGTEIPAHAFVLGFSPVLSAALTGEMQEASSKRVTIDCDGETARAFLKFLYIGSMPADSITSLRVFIDFIKLADFFGIADELAEACASEDSQAVISKLLDSLNWQIEEEQVVVSLEQLSKMQSHQARKLLRQCVERLDPKLGHNLFRCLCMFQALDAIDAFMQVSNSKVWILPSGDATWLEQEICEDVVKSIVDLHPSNSQLPILALNAYLVIVAAAVPSGVQPGRPNVGEVVQIPNGRCGLFLGHDGPTVDQTQASSLFGGQPQTGGLFGTPQPHGIFGGGGGGHGGMFGAGQKMFNVQLGESIEAVGSCAVHEHTHLLRTFPKVMKTVTDVVFARKIT